jgi:stearoyl-CoA desaturase (delta-9 desaturase)
MTEYKQTLLVVWGNHILFLLFLFFNFEWWMAPFLFLNMHLFGIFSEVSLHRYFTHKSYSTEGIRKHILKLFAFLTGQGAILTWVTTHRTHHAFEDTERDPHSPLFMPWWKIYLGLFKENYKKTLITDLLRDKDKQYYIFENKHYYLLWISTWVLSYLIHPMLFFFIVSGSAMWYFATSLVNILSHSLTVGTKRDESAVATNSGFLNFITGIGHHNNHHIDPKNYSYSLGGEVDVIAWVIEKFLKNDRA